MTKYLRDFKIICDYLAAICKPIESQKKGFWLLNCLGSEYKSFVTTMLKPPTPTYTEIIPLLQSHETCEPHNLNNQPIVFVSQNGPHFSQRGCASNNFSSRGRGFTQFGHHNKWNHPPNLPSLAKNRGPHTPISHDHGQFF
jgi:hypothetical protein